MLAGTFTKELEEIGKKTIINSKINKIKRAIHPEV